MRTYVVRIVNLVIILIALVGYNAVSEARAESEHEARIEAGIETAGAGDYEDGVYEGEAQGYGGPVRMKVTIKKSSIDDITVVSAENEDKSYWDMARDIIPEMVEAQTWDVDTISGATYSSTGIRDAVKQALDEATK